MGRGVSRRVYVNEAFRPQRVSGQQRYAREISDRLPAEFVRMRPSGFWASGKLQTWLWVQTVLPLKTWRGTLISMTARAPIWHPRHVLVIHDLFVIEHAEWFSRRYYLTHAPLQRFQMRTARRLLAVSQPVAEQISGRYSAREVVVAPNAPSDVFARPSEKDRTEVEERGLSTGDYLVAVGSLEPRKNLARLAEAYGRLPSARRAQLPLVVIGAGGDVFADAAIAWPDGVRLAGYVDDDALRALYAGAAAVVFVSLAEGFGLPLVEAAVAGTPQLIVSDLDVFRWICGDGATYVDPTDVTAITAALEDVGTSGGVSSAPDVSRFTWKVSAERVADAARSA